MLEAELELEACRAVLSLGGKTRKARWLGRRAAPDRFFMLPVVGPVWVEFKRPKGGVLQLNQLREIETMRRFKCRVEVIHTREQLDLFLAGVRRAIALAML